MERLNSGIQSCCFFRTAMKAFMALLAVIAPAALARGGDITAAAMGSIYNYNSLQGREVPPGGAGGPSSGDNWETCWGADDTLFAVHDDGFGFGHGMPGIAPAAPGPIKPDIPGPVPNVNHGLCRIDGDPNLATDSVRGINLNPGLYSYTLPATYSRDIYEVDGVLYAVKLFSNQRDKNFDGVHWDFFNISLIKSTDGGRNWYNHLGELNTAPPNNPGQCMFPDYRMAWPGFIHYGKGGEALAVDNADIYVYLVSFDSFGGYVNHPPRRGAYLARIPRARMAKLDKNDVEYFKSGDGMKDENWSKRIDDAKPIISAGNPKIVFNFAAKRYIMCNESIAGMNIFSARHPWGPWTKLLSHRTPGSYWGSLACNKWTTADGKKMWYIASGAYKGTLYPYAFLFNPVYLSQGAVDNYEAANARKTGDLRVENNHIGSDNCVAGFAKTGDALSFKIRRIRGKGWHIVTFEYAPTLTTGTSVSVYVNGRKVKRVDALARVGKPDKKPEKWVEYSAIYYLDGGTNTFELRQDEGDDATGLVVRRLRVSRETTYDEGENVALKAVATASSVAPGSSARAANDGCAAGGPNEWVSDAESSGAWVQLDWDKPVTVDKIALYDRSDPASRVTSGTLTFSDASAPVGIGHLQNDGKAPTVITVAPRSVRWVRFTIEGSSSSSAGLAELEVYRASKKR